MSLYYPSITEDRSTEPFGLQVARNTIQGHRVLHIFGYNPDVDSGAQETVWTYGGLYQHAPSPTIMTVSSSSTDDAAAGTGARTIYITGINGTGLEVSEIVTLNGQTAVNTTHSYTEINYIQVLTAGSNGANAGSLYVGTGTVTLGAPANVYGHVMAGENQSLIGHWTVPTDHTGYLVKGSISSGTPGNNQYVTGRLKLRTSDGIKRTAAIITFATGTVLFDFDYPVQIPGGACVTADVETNKTDDKVSSYFQLVLIKGPADPSPTSPKV